MRPIAENTVIQIEVTNACWLSCANCTRHVGHHANPNYMTVEEVEHAIRCTLASPCRIGLMGGEPTLHPHFGNLLALWDKLVPKSRREFWTSGFQWAMWKDEIKRIFDSKLIHYNDHTQRFGRHQPLLVAIDDVVDDEDFKRELIDACPYQTHWSASITRYGAYFCEIGASLDILFNEGRNAWPVEQGWWRRGVEDYEDQIKEVCGKCSGALPLPSYSDARGGRDKETDQDVISVSNLTRLQQVGSPKVADGKYVIWKRKITREDMSEDWKPRQYRTFEAHSPEESREGKLTERLRMG